MTVATAAETMSSPQPMPFVRSPNLAASRKAPGADLSPLTIPSVRERAISSTSLSPISALPGAEEGLPDAVRVSPEHHPSSHDGLSTTMPQARFVTASAILSRSGACIPLQSDSDFSFGPETDKEAVTSSVGQGTKVGGRPSKRHTVSGVGGGGSSKGPRQSNGSALEAFGALLLHRDSAGKVSNLSFRRAEPHTPGDDDDDEGSKLKPSVTTSSRSRRGKSKSGRRGSAGHGISQWVSQEWLERVREASSASLGLKLPRLGPGGSQPTIAERRALRDASAGSTLDADPEGYLVRSRRKNQPTFELSVAQKKPLLPQHKTVAQVLGLIKARRPGPVDRVGQCSSVEMTPTVGSSSAPHHSPRLPAHTRLLLKRSRTENNVSSTSSQSFGVGPLPPDVLDLPEAPPSPLAMPGAWTGSSSRKKSDGRFLSKDDMYEEGALLLPPPLLDDYGSDPTSFEGLLGIRRMREQEQRRQELERLRLRNRPAHKVGMITALSNFVKAAHAAERSAKGLKQNWGAQSLRRPDGPMRRHTAPVDVHDHSWSRPIRDDVPLVEGQEITSSEASLDDMEDLDLGGTFASSPSFRAAHGLSSAAASRKASIESAGRLDTVYETGDFEIEPSEDSIVMKDLGQSPRLAALRAARDMSRGSLQSLRDLPVAPRLLPVHLSRPPSPFTPLQTDYVSPNGTQTSDYLSNQRSVWAPATPRLGPTMLSLPPSPWTPHSSLEPAQGSWDVRLHLQSRRGSIEPGTPRLIPTHLDIAPSPLQTPSISNGFRLRASSETTEGSIHLEDSKIGDDALRNSPSSSSSVRIAEQHSPSLRQRRKLETPSQSHKHLLNEQLASSPARLTPAEVIATAAVLPSVGRRRSTSATFDQGVGESESRRGSSLDNSTQQTSAPTYDRTQGRTWFIWFLVGDLGLRLGARTETHGVGGVAGLAMHLVGFMIFVGAHLVALLYELYEDISLALWFTSWMFQNLTGRTVLAQCIIEAHRLIRKEWETVALEDHEDRGVRRKARREWASAAKLGRRGSVASAGSETGGEDEEEEGQNVTPRGLSRWQVVRGLMELACIQNVTRERYLVEGAGLEKLEGWRRRRTTRGSSNSRNSNDVGDRSQSEESENEDDGGEMYVTRKGADILELAKTPAPRPNKARTQSGYFGHDRGASDSAATPAIPTRTRENPTWSNDPHALVKTIKWASRLAISAYGLHVHIVDLPPTFTPSGERFSRQTFAHLSRLNADDVLHAEIQSLDAEAMYSPTFYIVRDYAREVVVVAIRGTQSLQDIIVDLDIDTEHVELPSVEGVPSLADSNEEQRCHAGIIRAAQALLEPDSSLFTSLRDALEQNPSFGVVFASHSLGAAISSTLAMLVCSYSVPDGCDPELGEWRTHKDSGLPAGRRVRALSFAHPATMSSALAMRCSVGYVPLVTSVVLGADIIPRTGHGQAREVRRVLGALARVRRRHSLKGEGGNDQDGEDDARVHVFSSWWDWRSIKRSDRPDDAMVHRRERIEEQLWRLRCDVEADLYAAVKGRAVAAAREKAVPPSPWVGPTSTPSYVGPKLHQLATRRQNLEARTVRSEEASGGVLVPAGKCIWVRDGELYDVTSPLSFFGLPDLDPALFAEHFPSAYESALEDLDT